MNRVDKLFKDLKRKKKKAFIAYITAGDPSLRVTEKLIRLFEEKGVDLIEIGIPFSDPLADGPTIQRASQRALSKGVRVKSILQMVRSARKNTELPIVFMTYYNIVYHYGLENFVRDAVRAGADGIIVPDLPCEEAGELTRAAKKKNFATIFLAAPTSTRTRLKAIAARSRGFIYYVSLTGTTGARSKLSQDIIGNVKTLKRITKKPVCVGFGLSTPAQAGRVARASDGVIVGSAIIKVIEKNTGKSGFYKNVGRFVGSLAKAVHGKHR